MVIFIVNIGYLILHGVLAPSQTVVDVYLLPLLRLQCLIDCFNVCSGQYPVDLPAPPIVLLLREGLLDLLYVDIGIAQGALLSGELDLRPEPFIDAFRVEEVLADGDLPDGHTVLEFLEADHTLRLLELVNTLIIWSLSD